MWDWEKSLVIPKNITQSHKFAYLCGIWTLWKMENLSEDNIGIKLTFLVLTKGAHKFCHSFAKISNQN